MVDKNWVDLVRQKREDLDFRDRVAREFIFLLDFLPGFSCILSYRHKFHVFVGR